MYSNDSDCVIMTPEEAFFRQTYGERAAERLMESLPLVLTTAYMEACMREGADYLGHDEHDYNGARLARVISIQNWLDNHPDAYHAIEDVDDAVCEDPWSVTESMPSTECMWIQEHI